MCRFLLIYTATEYKKYQFEENENKKEIVLRFSDLEEGRFEFIFEKRQWLGRVIGEGFVTELNGRTCKEFFLKQENTWEFQDTKGHRAFLHTYEEMEENRPFSLYLCNETTTVGRGKENNISAEDVGLLSEKHCSIWKNGTGGMLEDFSKNGTFVNGVRRQGTWKLQYGDVLFFYGFECVYLDEIIGVRKVHTSALKVELIPYAEEFCEKQCENRRRFVEERKLAEQKVSVGTITLYEDGESEKEPEISFSLGKLQIALHRSKKKEQIQRMQWYQKQERRLQEIQRQNQIVWKQESPSPKEWIEKLEYEKALWNMGVEKADSMWLRLGIGERRFSVQVETTGKEGGENHSLIQKLQERYASISNVPVGISLSQYTCVGIVEKHRPEYCLSARLLFSLLAGYSYRKIRLVVIYNEEEEWEKRWFSGLRWVLHTWDLRQQSRFFATNQRETEELLNNLQICKEERDTIVFCTNPKWVLQEEVQETIAMVYPKDRWKFLFCVDNLEELPFFCEQILEKKDERIVFHKETEEQEIVLKEDVLEFSEWERWLELLNRYRLKNADHKIWEKAGLLCLEQNSGRKGIQETILENWKESFQRIGITGNLGWTVKGTVCSLHLHEKADGVHGLVVGMTGSGKSESLQSYLLSVAMREHPEKVHMLLLDCKGGTMAKSLIKLPHVVGVLTNTEPAMLDRGLVALEHEIQSREKRLGEENCKHIDEYNGKCKKQERLPYLCIVVDEFAELIQCYEKFEGCLERIVRVGRSLGMHLLLSTQKTEGIVKDSLLDNMGIVIGFGIQNQGEISRLLGDSCVWDGKSQGRGYCKKHNQIVEFQGAYSSEPFEKIEICMPMDVRGQNCGKKDTHSVKEWQYLTELLQDIYEKTEGKKGEPKLWQPLLPKQCNYPVKNLREALGVFYLGIGDVPHLQQQFVWKENWGSIGFVGKSGKGKTFGIELLLMQALEKYSEDQLECYIVDEDSNFYLDYEKFPQVIAVGQKKDAVEKILFVLEREMEQRKKLELCQLKKMPKVCLLVDGMGNFRRIVGNRELEVLEQLLEQGERLQCYLWVTGCGFGPKELPFSWRKRLKLFGLGETGAAECFKNSELPAFTDKVPGRAVGIMEGQTLELQLFCQKEQQNRKDCWNKWKEKIARLQNWEQVKQRNRLVLLPEDYTLCQHLEEVEMENKRAGICIGRREMDGSFFWQIEQGKETLLVVCEKKTQMEAAVKTFGVLFQACEDYEMISNTLEYFQEEEKRQQWFQAYQKKEKFRLLFCLQQEYGRLREYEEFREIMEQANGLYIGSGIMEQMYFPVGIVPGNIRERMWKNGSAMYICGKTGKQELLRIPLLDEEGKEHE